MQRTETALKTLIGIKRTNDMIDHIIRSDVKSYGLSVTAFAVLELLYNKGEHTIQRIQERILIASSSTTYVINSLENKGYLQRRQCTKDRRVSYISLTDKGQQLMDNIFPKHTKAIEQAFSILTDEELATLQQTLKTLSTQHEH
ncbi:MarR family winged helix-turn-helix transcriptional regulator [Staphylococcus delphini]|uniref:MarR family transcriptional regulator n=1 Tax=Staphylococcus delphini TaxID=53344 RepID=A0AAX0QXB6_9STAP|nr:MarR family transcriptional regulator [Staphylococcus delphini]NBK47338.1 MarR family transcriptional regulator [Staphylococcus delphini]PCF52648.1 MarR family transcriptional regulator [Staphylococcus delphini]PNZ96459.1 MarR family transcriptional regulator [Staphylococcus delphini]RIZ56496.1 MarR family transcriptional regulator [Staphylococcus delphini]UXS29259.1 MarR family transcriptional regulator [Staphylococcus delphini]